MKQGKMIKVSGPPAAASGMEDINIYDVMEVSDNKLIGEVIEMWRDKALIQVYEETIGIGLGDLVASTGLSLSVELGPGSLEQMFDGIQRPLQSLQDLAGDFLERGATAYHLDREKKWTFKATAKTGDQVEAGDILGQVRETPVIIHKIIVPNGVAGKVLGIKEGDSTVDQTITVSETEEGKRELNMTQKWPVRRGRLCQKKVGPNTPLVTGQRVINTFFPIIKGGTAAIPGPFGPGRTVVQYQLAKRVDVEIVVHVGCGERGDETTDVLMEFPELID